MTYLHIDAILCGCLLYLCICVSLARVIMLHVESRCRDTIITVII